MFPACQMYLQIQEEKSVPYEIAASTDSPRIDLDTLMQIEGVENISPIIYVDSSLHCDDYTLDCEMKAVYSSYLDLQFTQGVMYPDNSNMPYLILNKAAARSFAMDGKTYSVAPEDTVLLYANGSERKAVICGIFDDGSEIPAAYMSYNVAARAFSQGSGTELVFALENKGAAESIVSNLQRRGIYADFDSGISLSWELKQKQCRQTAMLSFGLFACSAVLIRQKRHVEKMERKGEMAALLLSGMTANDLRAMYLLRMILTEEICIMLVAVISGITGALSLFGIGIAIFCMVIYFITVI